MLRCPPACEYSVQSVNTSPSYASSTYPSLSSYLSIRATYGVSLKDLSACLVDEGFPAICRTSVRKMPGGRSWYHSALRADGTVTRTNRKNSERFHNGPPFRICHSCYSDWIVATILPRQRIVCLQRPPIDATVLLQDAGRSAGSELRIRTPRGQARFL